MTVAYWQVITKERVTDEPLMASVDGWAEGELRLEAARQDAELTSEPRSTRIELYWVDSEDDDGNPVRRLESAGFLRVLGLPIPDEPDAVLVRWEADTKRKVWPANQRRTR